MRRLVLAMFMSIEGYIAGPNGEFNTSPLVGPLWSDEVRERGRSSCPRGAQRANHSEFSSLNFDQATPSYSWT